MTKAQSREAARIVLKAVPFVGRAIATALRSAGEFPAPAHYSLLTTLIDQPRTLTELAALQGVSLPTMSNSISAMEERGLVGRSSPVRDRRVVIIEVTPVGRAVLKRVRRCAEAHIAGLLLPHNPAEGRRIQAGLRVLFEIFVKEQAAQNRRPRAQRRSG